MDKNLYLNLSLSTAIILGGFYWTSEITDFWISHVWHVGVMFISALVIIGFSFKKFPKKGNASLQTTYLIASIIGILGLYAVNNFIPVLATKLAGLEIQNIYHEPKLDKTFVRLISLVICEEILFRRIITQKNYNQKGFRKGVWISALIYSLVHIYSGMGLLGTFIGGALFAYIYLKTKSIYLIIAIHLIYNVTTYFLTPILIINIIRINSYSQIISIIAIGVLLIFAMTWIIRHTEKQLIK